MQKKLAGYRPREKFSSSVLFLIFRGESINVFPAKFWKVQVSEFECIHSVQICYKIVTVILRIFGNNYFFI